MPSAMGTQALALEWKARPTQRTTSVLMKLCVEAESSNVTIGWLAMEMCSSIVSSVWSLAMACMEIVGVSMAGLISSMSRVLSSSGSVTSM